MDDLRELSELSGDDLEHERNLLAYRLDPLTSAEAARLAQIDAERRRRYEDPATHAQPDDSAFWAAVRRVEAEKVQKAAKEKRQAMRDVSEAR